MDSKQTASLKSRNGGYHLADALSVYRQFLESGAVPVTFWCSCLSVRVRGFFLPDSVHWNDFRFNGYEINGGSMISFNRVPTHIDSAAWSRRTRKNAREGEEEQTVDFEELFKAVSENLETVNLQSRLPSGKNQRQPGKRPKLDLSV